MSSGARSSTVACLLLAASMLATAGCSEIGPYVWVQELPPAEVIDPRSAAYKIGIGDQVSVHVVDQDNISARTKVRADGRISIAFVGEIRVNGKSTAEAAREIEDGLRQYIKNPQVTVSVEESPPTSVSVVGEVGKPGVYPLEPPAGVLEAIAAAGGITEFASKERIFVLRRSVSPPIRIRFTFQALTHNEPKAVSFALVRGDVVVVE